MMKILKESIQFLTVVSLAVLIITDNAVAAIPLLATGSATVGILIGQKIEKDKRK